MLYLRLLRFLSCYLSIKIKPSEIEYVNDKSHLMGLYTDICGGLVDIKVNQEEDKFQELNNILRMHMPKAR